MGFFGWFFGLFRGKGREDNALKSEVQNLRDELRRKEDEIMRQKRLKKDVKKGLKDEKKVSKKLKKMRLGGLENETREIEEDEKKILSGDYSPQDELIMSEQIMKDVKKEEKILNEELRDAFRRKDSTRIHELQHTILLLKNEEKITKAEVSEEKHELKDDAEVVAEIHETENIENQEHEHHVA